VNQLEAITTENWVRCGSSCHTIEHVTHGSKDLKYLYLGPLVLSYHLLANQAKKNRLPNTNKFIISHVVKTPTS
jgi:hypothetical protein